MSGKAKVLGMIIAGFLVIGAILSASRAIRLDNPGLSRFDSYGKGRNGGGGGSMENLGAEEKDIPDAAIAQTMEDSGKKPESFRENREKKTKFEPFSVIDDGTPLPDNQEYTGIVCNMKDSDSERISIRMPDGELLEEEVSTFHLNNIWFSVPKGGSRCFGVPIFSTEYYAEGEWEKQKEWDDVEGIDYPDFNEGMETARALIREGYLQKDLENFLLRYPEISPGEREYALYLTGGGRTDRESDDTSWWELDYMLTTTAENGEQVAVAYLDITKIIKAQGWESTDDARCRIWSGESGYWRLLEDPATDLGEIWISQIPEEDFSEEEKARAYVESRGADFDRLLPKGADREVSWECRKEETGWYDYLVYSGTTDTYELTLAIPLMEEGEGGWYLASRIRKEAAQKKLCEDTLFTMMRTFHRERYAYTVKEGETLSGIYRRYGEKEKYSFEWFMQYNHIDNPDLIYPGKRLKFPYLR